jgi:hypothetical protein
LSRKRCRNLSGNEATVTDYRYGKDAGKERESEDLPWRTKPYANRSLFAKVDYLVPAANGGQGKRKGQENWVQPFKLEQA